VQEELEQRERLLKSNEKVSRQRKEHGKDFSRIAKDPRRSRGKTFAEKV
jgi:hypothetical protein